MPHRSDFPEEIDERDLARLTGRQMTCLLRFLKGRSAAFIAGQLGIHEETVRGHLEVALAKLRHEFIPRRRAYSLDEALDDGLDERLIRAWV